nr:linear gramicidin synthase subunit B [uncultured bacterium]
MTLLAAFQALLYRYSGQEEIVIGTTVANRNRAELERTPGLFLNTLALRGDLSGAPTFKDLLARARETALGAYAHQDVPFEALVEELQPERSLSHSPIFQVALSLQHASQAALNLPGVRSVAIPAPGVSAKTDVLLDISEAADGLAVRLEYNTDLFDRPRMERLLEHYRNLLEAVVTDPEQRIARLPLLTQAERQQLLTQWNETQAEYARELCIHQLFEQQVERTPDATALEFQGERLTYQQLNARANQLAHYLRRQGVGPETLVGLCIERSLEMVVALLGILKAGGAYLPLDPSYPVERLNFMLEDSGARVLLTQPSCLERLSRLPQQLVLLERDRERIAAESETNLQSDVYPENLAYVIYTSGSTGRPKGAEVPHRGLCNVVAAQLAGLGVRPGSRVLQFASLSFDASIFEVVMALGSGSTLCLGSSEQLMPGPDLARFLKDAVITTVTLPPSALTATTVEELPALRTITVAGEACPEELVKQWGAGRRFYNLYGPTESTIWASYSECFPGGGRPLIGRPIANTQLYLLDRHFQAVPVGVPGELYIGGAGVARGYLNRPSATAEKFVPDPFSGEAGGRLYRTGDLARYLPDGKLEFLGRIDQQVKVRGFRIEPGEIESTLLQHSGVREAIVLSREAAPGEKRLVAYVVPSNGALSASELREHLKQSLPEYMVPSAFVVLEALPLSPNGKVDRKALPAPDGSRPELESAYEAPRTATEKALAEIWTEVLRVERVGIHDNFFELGGDSILSIQIIARANQAGLRLTPRQVFQHQTIAGLATVAGTGAAAAGEQGSVSGATPLTPIQRWFFELDLNDAHHFNQSRLLQLPPTVPPAHVERAVASLVAHHDALRLRFSPTEEGWQQTNAAVEENAFFSLVELSDHSDPSDWRIALTRKASELQASLNLDTGPLLRVCYFDVGSQKPARLLIAIHHLAIDGISWRVLLEDLQTALEQLARGEEVALPAKTTSFQQWARRLVEYAGSEALEREAPYWRSASRQPVRSLPVDYSGGENRVASRRAVTVSLTADETKALLTEVPAAYHTQINDLLLTALLQAFALWTGERALLVGMEGHGREALFEEVDLSRTVGWFTSLYPVPLELPAGGGIGEALKSIKEQLRQVPNHGIGYGILRYLSDNTEVRSALSALPEPQVSFNYHGYVDVGCARRRALEAGERVGRPGTRSEGAADSPSRRDRTGEARAAGTGLVLQRGVALAYHSRGTRAWVPGGAARADRALSLRRGGWVHAFRLPQRQD